MENFSKSKDTSDSENEQLIYTGIQDKSAASNREIRINSKNNDWEELELAILKKDIASLKKLTDTSFGLQIRFEAAVELNNQELLSNLAMNNEDELIAIRSLYQITDRSLILLIINNARNENIQVEAAIKLMDKEVSRKLFGHLSNENNKYRLVKAIGDPELFRDCGNNQLMSIEGNSNNG